MACVPTSTFWDGGGNVPQVSRYRQKIPKEILIRTSGRRQTSWLPVGRKHRPAERMQLDTAAEAFPQAYGALVGCPIPSSVSDRARCAGAWVRDGLPSLVRNENKFRQ